MKEFIEILASIPFVGILRNVFGGELGWKPPVGFVLQVVLQIVVACLIGVGTVGGILVGGSLIVAHLLIALMIGMMPLSGMGPKPMYKTPARYLALALTYSLGFTAVACGVILGLASIFATGSFLLTFALSVLGGTAIHMFAVALSVYQLEKRRERELQS